MKLILGMVSILIAATGIAGSQADAFVGDDGRNYVRVEVPAKIAFAPSSGFDDNDNVQVVLYGELPNGCYGLDKYEIERAAEHGPNVIKIRQFAIRRTDGVCSDHTQLTGHLKFPVPYTSEILIGPLEAGWHYFRYLKDNRATGTAVASLSIEISKATRPSVDERTYAAVSNALVSDVIEKGSDIEVTLSGVNNSTCTYLDDVEVRKLDGVYVILPYIKVKKNAYCTQVLVPFKTTINLGKADRAGRFLVHVRSMSGKSLNSVFSVQD